MNFSRVEEYLLGRTNETSTIFQPPLTPIIESFFYILLLFFLSSKGPMDKCGFLQAKRHGFTLGSEVSTHTCNWPSPYKSWIRHSDLDTAISSKTAVFDRSSPTTYFFPLAVALHLWSPHTLANCIVHLVVNCWKHFAGQPDPGRKAPQRVKHEMLIKELDRWLEETVLPKECNNCPFFVRFIHVTLIFLICVPTQLCRTKMVTP